jgi:DNA-binding NarL/FixJ family response regulator
MAAGTGVIQRVRQPAAGPLAVILIDDHPANLAGLHHLFETEPGVQLVGDAADPQEGLTMAEALRPDVAVVDLVFADASGFDLIRDLRLRCPGCRVVAYTAMEGPGYPEQCLRVGASGYVAKSEPLSHLVRAVRLAGEGRNYLSDERAGELLSRLTAGGRLSDDAVLPLDERLSPGEFHVFHLIGQGMSNGQIAQTLHRSIKTVETYRSRIKRKLRAANGTHLAQLASAHFHDAGDGRNLLPPPAAMPELPPPDSLRIAEPAATLSITGVVAETGSTVAIASAARAQVEQPPSRRRVVLVVEDHDVVRKPLVTLLKHRSYDTREACDGVEALAVLEAGAVDVVLLDLMMPRMDGLALLGRMRADARWGNVPVIIMTGAFDPEVLERARRLTRHVLTKAAGNPEMIFGRLEVALAEAA